MSANSREIITCIWQGADEFLPIYGNVVNGQSITVLKSDFETLKVRGKVTVKERKTKKLEVPK